MVPHRKTQGWKSGCRVRNDRISNSLAVANSCSTSISFRSLASARRAAVEPNPASRIKNPTGSKSIPAGLNPLFVSTTRMPEHDKRPFQGIYKRIRALALQKNMQQD